MDPELPRMAQGDGMSKRPTSAELAERLRALSAEMIEVGAAMEYYGGFAPWGFRGKSLVGAARTIEGWIAEMEPHSQEAMKKDRLKWPHE